MWEFLLAYLLSITLLATSELIYLKNIPMFNRTDIYPKGATLYVSSSDPEDMLNKITIMSYNSDFDSENKTAYDLANAYDGNMKRGFNVTGPGLFFIITTMEQAQLQNLNGVIYIVNEQNPPSAVYDVNTTKQSVEIKGGTSAAFFTFGQTLKPTPTTKGTTMTPGTAATETTASPEPTTVTPPAEEFVYRCVLDFHMKAVNSIIGIYNGTEAGSQQLYSNSINPSATIYSIYLTVPFFMVNTSADINFDVKQATDPEKQNVTMSQLPASGLISSDNYPFDGTSQHMFVETDMKTFSTIGVRGKYTPRGWAQAVKSLADDLSEYLPRFMRAVDEKDYLTLTWTEYGNQRLDKDNPGLTHVVTIYDQRDIDFSYPANVLEINTANYQAQGPYTLEYFAYVDNPQTQTSTPIRLTTVSGGNNNNTGTTKSPCPGFSPNFRNFKLIIFISLLPPLFSFSF